MNAHDMAPVAWEAIVASALEICVLVSLDLELKQIIKGRRDKDKVILEGGVLF